MRNDRSGRFCSRSRCSGPAEITVEGRQLCEECFAEELEQLKDDRLREHHELSRGMG